MARVSSDTLLSPPDVHVAVERAQLDLRTTAVDTMNEAVDLETESSALPPRVLSGNGLLQASAQCSPLRAPTNPVNPA
jgi:hypothetical protein